MTAGSRDEGAESSRADILDTAATCFMERGYTETTMDDIARSLGATKGRVYHHFRSKADILAAIFRIGMDGNFAAVEPCMTQGGPASQRWKTMARAHALRMLTTKPYQRMVWVGVKILLRGATTPEQRHEFEHLLQRRSEYSSMFRQTILQGRDEGDFDFDDVSVSNQLMFVVLNSPIFWYAPRPGETRADVEILASQVVRAAFRGLGGRERGRKE